MNGILNILKPPGMTSSDVVCLLRGMLREKRIGHTGTLDPAAAGVLPIMIGRATRLFDVLMSKDKTYITELCVGVETATQDQCGEMVRSTPAKVDIEQLRNILPRFIGEIGQVPPAYSAVKLQGRKLYQYARNGEQIEAAARRVTVRNIEIGEQTAPDRVMLTIYCGKGTYVRTLCHDIGAALGVGAHCGFLLRTAAGRFGLSNSHTLEEVEETVKTGDAAALLMPMDMALDHLRQVNVELPYRKELMNGRPVLPQWTLENTVGGENEQARVYCENKLYGIADWEDEKWRVRTMLWEGER